MRIVPFEASSSCETDTARTASSSFAHARLTCLLHLPYDVRTAQGSLAFEVTHDMLMLTTAKGSSQLYPTRAKLAPYPLHRELLTDHDACVCVLGEEWRHGNDVDCTRVLQLVLKLFGSVEGVGSGDSSPCSWSARGEAARELSTYQEKPQRGKRRHTQACWESRCRAPPSGAGPSCGGQRLLS